MKNGFVIEIELIAWKLTYACLFAFGMKQLRNVYLIW